VSPTRSSSKQDSPLEEYEKEVRGRAAEEISAGLGAEGFDAAYSRGRSMGAEEAVAFALTAGAGVPRSFQR
jgi:hypothetical protein